MIPTYINCEHCLHIVSHFTNLTGYSSHQLWSTLPVDIMLGQLTTGEEGGKGICQYVQGVQQLLKSA